MKTYLIFCFITGAVMINTSCDRFLSTVPADFVSPNEYFSNEQEVNAALTGIYDALAQEGTYSRMLSVQFPNCTDEGFYKRNTSAVTLYTYDYEPSNANIVATWRELYRGVNRANLLLANIDRANMTERKRQAAKGEALFLRAFIYFQLVNYWGDVPLRLEPTISAEEVNIPRTNSLEIFKQIEHDMQVAESLVYEISDVGFGGRVSRSAVQGVLARVYLKWAGYPLNDKRKFEDARRWANKVIESGQHALNLDFKQVFINHSADLYDIKESIWEIEFYGNSSAGADREGSRFANDLGIRQTNNEYGYNYGFIGATGILYDKYTDNDVRRDWTIAPYSFQGSNTNNKVYKGASDIYTREVGKWRKEYETYRPYGVNWGPANFPILRYADVLLMMAEAENEVNGPESALPYLNEVRGRANADEFELSDVPDQVTFRGVMMDERARELAFEGLRKFDLIRWGVFLQIMRATGNEMERNAPSSLAWGVRAYRNVREKHVLQPIPSLELSLNRSMTQNPGW